MPKSQNAVAILADKSWSVVEFNGGAHLRINGVVDVRPRKQGWWPTGALQNTRRYSDIDDLKRIVREAQKERDEVRAKIEALKDKPAMERDIPQQISMEDWERMFK